MNPNMCQVAIVLAMALLTISALSTTDDAPALCLSVSSNGKSGPQSEHLDINCTLDTTKTELETVTSLTLLGSRPSEDNEEFDQLAELEIWTNSPMMADELEDIGVYVSGAIGSLPFLQLSSPINLRRDPYMCVAHGIDKAGKPRSLSTTTKPDTALHSVLVELHAISTQIDLGVKTSEGLVISVESLHGKVDGLEAKIDAISVSARVHSTILAAYVSNFDVSGLYKERLYLASKQEAEFSIASANNVCIGAGGYLVEIEDDEESKFLLAFATGIGGADIVMTGGNDIDHEGQFVYFNSKEPVPDHLTWLVGEPNNYEGNEDCMHFWISQQGLNDVSCTVDAKFICEIPIKKY